MRWKRRSVGTLAVMAVAVVGAAAGAQNSLNPLTLTPRAEVPPAPAPPRTVTIPAETEVAAQLLSGIHTQVSHRDDPIKAKLLQPIYIKGRVALPTGSLLDGRITRVRFARHLNRPAELTLRFERITLPDGQAEPILGVLASLDKPGPPKTRLDREGYLRGAPAFTWRRIAGGLFVLGTLATAKATLAGTAAWGPLLPVSGAALLSYEIVWPRGNDVHVPPDTRCRIRLTYPLTVRVAW